MDVGRIGSFVTALLFPLFGMGSCIATGGCTDSERTADLMTFLERGHAEGELQVGSQGAVSIGATNEFFLGLKGTTINFSGKIDFKEAHIRNTDGTARASPSDKGLPGILRTAYRTRNPEYG